MTPFAFVFPHYEADHEVRDPDGFHVAGIDPSTGTLDLDNAVDLRVLLGVMSLDLPFDVVRAQWANTSNRFIISHANTVWVYDLDAEVSYEVAPPPSVGSWSEGSWSPDDSEIAITGNDSKFKQSVYKVSSDGSGTSVKLGSGRHPNWWKGQDPVQ